MLRTFAECTQLWLGTVTKIFLGSVGWFGTGLTNTERFSRSCTRIYGLVLLQLVRQELASATTMTSRPPCQNRTVFVRSRNAHIFFHMFYIILYYFTHELIWPNVSVSDENCLLWTRQVAGHSCCWGQLLVNQLYITKTSDIIIKCVLVVFSFRTDKNRTMKKIRSVLRFGQTVPKNRKFRSQSLRTVATIRRKAASGRHHSPPYYIPL
jgi:hypothetical protein